MKYLKRIEKEQYVTELLSARRPCVMMADESLSDEVSIDMGVTVSGNLIYKGGGTIIFMMNDYGKPLPDFTASINGVDFTPTTGNVAYMVPTPFDSLTMKLIYTPDSNLVPLYAMADYFRNKILPPQSYYDYLSEKELTESDIKTQLSSTDTDAVKALQLDMVDNGFYCFMNDSNLVVCTRGDVDNAFPEINDSTIAIWINSPKLYDKQKKEIKRK